ncbi:F0F1 ATP synthase subunit epsilon [Telmatospirillum siberiense]|uniref:ATP synthase epsilon chain n=1 Tax=Telmatospirillum siberiense TaxID=382514 RepID=A0A2N3PYA8_9PROT|nr:F0F1 ATP synthase subunit epsilon [Telmatospirillum siberiense]PKU25355.1 F0F1 ATP synthase subunit epsilon [Telmatospirillum siberiense]
MAEKVEFELVSPERLLVSEPVEMVVVPGTEGDFGALPHHAPMITTVRPGVIDIYQDGKVTDRIFVAGGFAEVTETRVTVLAEEATKVAELDPAEVNSRLKAAEQSVEEADGDAARNEARRGLLVAQAMRVALDAALPLH